MFVSIKNRFSIDIPDGFQMEGPEGKFTSWSYRPRVTDEGDIENVGVVLPRISVVTTDIPDTYSDFGLFSVNVKRVEEEMADKTSFYRDLEIFEYEGGYAFAFREIIKDDPFAINHRFLYVFMDRRHYIVDVSATYDIMRDWHHSFDRVISSFHVP
jgi:hypothetical protein